MPRSMHTRESTLNQVATHHNSDIIVCFSIVSFGNLSDGHPSTDIIVFDENGKLSVGSCLQETTIQPPRPHLTIPLTLANDHGQNCKMYVEEVVW